MNDSLIKDYLTFFKNEKVDLRNEGINEKIDFYFERTSFLNKFSVSLIISFIIGYFTRSASIAYNVSRLKIVAKNQHQAITNINKTLN